MKLTLIFLLLCNACIAQKNIDSIKIQISPFAIKVDSITKLHYRYADSVWINQDTTYFCFTYIIREAVIDGQRKLFDIASRDLMYKGVFEKFGYNLIGISKKFYINNIKFKDKYPIYFYSKTY